jgi:PEP-CTERM motif
MSRNIILGFTLAAALAAAAPVSAELVVGGPGDTGTGNCYPFGCAGWGPTYQQVYAATNFSGPLSITGLSFYNTQYLNGGSVASGNFTISLSTTSVAVNALSTDFVSNRGGNFTQVFNASLPALANGRLDIALSSAFNYDPGAGNLLMEVFAPAAFSPTPLFLDARNGTAGGVFSRVYSVDGTTYALNRGLVTGFASGAVVPEPQSWALLVAGFGLVGAVLRRRQPVAA